MPFAGIVRRVFGTRQRDAGAPPARAVDASTPADVHAAVATLIRARRFADALASVAAALEPSADPALVALRGAVLFEWGRIREAREDLVAAVAAGADPPMLLTQLGWASLWSGDPVEAERWMRRAVARNAADWHAHFGLGGALRAQGRLDDAIAAYDEALRLAPGDAACLAEIVGCRMDARRTDEALDAAQRLAREHPDDPQALAACANVLTALDRFDEANAVFAQAAALPAVSADPTRMPLDSVLPLLEGGRVDDAIRFCERHLPRRPEPNAHLNYALALLKSGRLNEGFAQYEFRWMVHPLVAQRMRYGVPVWSGQPLAGKTLLVVTEQGFGDIIQFLRYLPLIRARGARILLRVYRAMPGILDEGPLVDRIVQAGEPIPAADYCAHLLSLARVLGSDEATIRQGVPYLLARADRAAHWASRMPTDAQLKVGLVWSGDPQGRRGRQKSTSLATLAPWSNVRGVRFFSLQKGDAAKEAQPPPPGWAVTDLAPDIRDFADTAAIIASLDLVISVCTSVAHLAGAMGKPVWTMLAEPADWRWLEGRDDTPWYPTMRLFRQSRQGDWGGVVARVGEALEALARDHATSSSAGPERANDRKPGQPGSPAPSGEPAAIPGMCAVVEARHGIFQHHPDGAPGERALAWYGEDLEPQLDLLRARIAPGVTVLEAGSGVGAHAVPLAAHLGAAGHLFVCETRDGLATVLQHNLAANEIRGVTTLHTTLLGTAGGGDAAAAGAADADASANVAAAADDAHATVDRLGLRRLDWLKIGEGMDAEAILAGAADTLWAQRPGVFAAVADVDGLARVAGRLRDFGYHCWRVDTPRFRPGNFNRRDDDIFAGAVVHAVLAVPEESTAVPPVGLQALD